MKRSIYLCVGGLVVSMLLPISSMAQSAKTFLAKPPITYPGDTDQTINRRAQWIEGAKKEGKVAWWGSFKPKDAKALISEFNKVYPFIEVAYWNARGEQILPTL